MSSHTTASLPSQAMIQGHVRTQAATRIQSFVLAEMMQNGCLHPIPFLDLDGHARLAVHSGDQLPIARGPRIVSCEALAHSSAHTLVEGAALCRGQCRCVPLDDVLGLLRLGRDRSGKRLLRRGRNLITGAAHGIHVELTPDFLRILAQIFDECRVG